MILNKVTHKLICVVCFLVSVWTVSAMPLKMDREAMISFTPEWKGERFPDGRPKVSDSIIERMKLVDIEAAWVVLRNEGYEYHIHGPGYTTSRSSWLLRVS